jgi:hypothetical protein
VGVQHTPLIFPTVVVLAVVFVEWKHTRAVAWAALAAAFVLLVGVLRYPTFSAAEIADFAQQGLAVALVVARTLAVACFMWTMVRTIRSSGVPW